MAGSVKGITIEFNGDTTRLDKALREINNKTRSIDQELRKVNNALKFNPTSVELWRQKQELLKQKIDETKLKLDALKQAQDQMDTEGVDKNSKDYRDLQREIISTESKLKTFSAQLKQVGNVKLKALSEQFKQAGDKLTAAGNAMRGVSAAGAAMTATLGAVAYKAGVAADDLNTLSKVTGIGTDKLQMYNAAADLVDVSTEAIAKSNTRLKKSMMSASDGSGTQAEAFKQLGISVTNADGSLRDSDAVFQDVLSSLGSMTNETERDALAMTLMGKSASELNPLIEDGGETYKNVADTLKKYDLEFVSQEDLNAANSFNDSLDTMKVLGTVAIQTVGTQLAAYLAPALEKVVGWVGQLAQWLSTLSPTVLTVIGIIGSVIAVIAPLLLILGKLAFAISSIMSLAGTLGISLSALAGPVGIVIAVIGALIAVGVLLYKNWDTIKAKASALKASLVATWESIKRAVFEKVRSLIQNVVGKWGELKTKTSTIFENIKKTISDKIKAAKDKVEGIIDKIKGYFPIKVGNLFGKINLPKFNISWETVGSTKIKIPKFTGITWHAQGAIFDSPALFMGKNGAMHGIGEAGPEAVVPLDKFWKKMDQMQSGTVVNITINAAEGQSAREIAAEVKRELIREAKKERLAWQ